MRYLPNALAGTLIALLGWLLISQATGADAAGGQDLQAPVRIREKFDFDWKFHKGDVSGGHRVDCDDARWRDLHLPHDWSIEGPFLESNPSGERGGFSPGGIGWYRKYFRLPAGYQGKKVFIQLDGVYHQSDVYINGQHLGHRPYGYVSFVYDLTPYLDIEGENVLAVRVDHEEVPTDRWYSGSGIYRHVWLIVTEPLHVSHWGTYITTPKIGRKSATVRVRTEVVNEHNQAKDCLLVTSIVGPDGQVVAQATAGLTLPAGRKRQFDQSLKIPEPALWSIEEPHLYMAHTAVINGENVVDTYETTFGVRQVRINAKKGFFLNGRPMKMKGVNIHHDAGCVGSAVPDRVLERRLEVLKELGCNAIRMSHNPPAPELLDMCDRMGFLVIDEAFDKWRSRYYARFFNQWWEQDLDAMIRRDRNHPSVILWSVGNEVSELGKPEGGETLKMLVDYVHEQEPTRLVTCALQPGFRYNPTRVKYAIPFADYLDVVGYNYQESWYESDKKAHPDWIILGTECYPYYRGRDGHHKDFSPVNPWYDVVRHDYVIGQFLWTGIDYLGESRGWPSKGWSTGLISTCGFLKPQSYFHRSVWRDEPMVHVAVLDDGLDIDPGKPHWSWPKMASHWNFAHRQGEVIRVVTHTNCETVELMLNGQSLGIRRSVDYSNSTILWYVPYTAGQIEAIGYNGGQVMAAHKLRTAGEPAAIALLPDHTEITADGQDVSHVDVRLVDAESLLVPDSDRLILFGIKGPGKIIGVDNGDLRSPEPYQGNRRTTCWGRCLAIVQAAREPGVIRITAKADGLPGASVVIRSE